MRLNEAQAMAAANFAKTLDLIEDRWIHISFVVKQDGQEFEIGNLHTEAAIPMSDIRWVELAI